MGSGGRPVTTFEVVLAELASTASKRIICRTSLAPDRLHELV